MPQETAVQLTAYTDQYKQIIRNYTINELEFTGSPLEAIERCEQEAGRHAILVFFDQILVGFFVLHDWAGAKKYTKNRHALLLRTFSIDSRYQGRGYGRRTIEQLDGFVKVHFPKVDEIVLGVNHANIKAQNLYLHHGFEDTGSRVIGIHGEQLVLSKGIRKMQQRS
ncbi:MAG: GNAT family N-acetyltransferase [Sporolactobacillus sp.]